MEKTDKMFCENCGSRVLSGRCANCYEESFIFDQYVEQDMELPSEDSDFMKKAREQQRNHNKV